MTMIQQQYAKKSKQIQAAKREGRWGQVKKLKQEREALKSALRGGVPHINGSRPSETVETSQEDDSRTLPFNFYYIPGSQQAAVLVDQIFSRWTQHHQFKRSIPDDRLQAYRQIIETVISNLLYVYSIGQEAVLITREKKRLSARSRYRPTCFNEKLLTVLDDLHAMGVIEQRLGERWGRDYAKVFGFSTAHRPRRKNQTELHTTPHLEALRSQYRVTRPADVCVLTDQQEVIILKEDERSGLVEYQDTDQTVTYRTHMQHINRMLEEAGNLLAPECQNIPRFDQRQRFLVRKFTHSSLESGGRLWGGFWMNVKKKERPYVLRINQERTVELDYRSIIVHLAYIVAEAPQPTMDDLYNIPGLSIESRPGIKKLMGALLFDQSPTRSRFPQGVGELFSKEDRSKGFASVVGLIRQAHPNIAHLFGTGIGHYLQYLESCVLVKVLLSCQRAGIVALPIHDAVIVASSHRDTVREFMRLASLEVVGRSIPVGL
ncbi:MAG: hypothetical protein RI101_12990 [Nitrospira sp.]|jgi:hypothetical protein|nr:hypothetical protein [Nitrospira sp.]